MRTKRVSAREHAEVLEHDGFEEGSHQLVRRRAGFLQAVDVGFREDAAFSSDLVQFNSVVGLIGKLGGWNF